MNIYFILIKTIQSGKVRHISTKFLKNFYRVFASKRAGTCGVGNSLGWCIKSRLHQMRVILNGEI